MNVSQVETIEFNARGGADTITIGDLTGTGVKAVNVDLASTAGQRHWATAQPTP